MHSVFLVPTQVTGFSDDEERAVGLDGLVPFLTEAELRQRGGIYSKASDAWAPYTVTDGKLVTGNPEASALAVPDRLTWLKTADK